MCLLQSCSFWEDLGDSNFHLGFDIFFLWCYCGSSGQPDAAAHRRDVVTAFPRDATRLYPSDATVVTSAPRSLLQGAGDANVASDFFRSSSSVFPEAPCTAAVPSASAGVRALPSIAVPSTSTSTGVVPRPSSSAAYSPAGPKRRPGPRTPVAARVVRPRTHR